MNKDEFLNLLRTSTYTCCEFAKNYITDNLLKDFKYIVILNVSTDDPSLLQFDVYPEDSGKKVELIDEKDVEDLLYRNGKIPVWIDISVECIHQNKTVIRLLCAGRYSDKSQDYYYNHHDTVSPFGIKGPVFPIGYVKGEKFRLKNRYKKSFLSRLKALFNK